MTERSTESILSERAGQHGNFADNANLATELMSIVEDSPNADAVTADPTIKVGIFMILHKLARALSGDLRYVDHWDDIAGYAKLVSKHVARPDGKVAVGQPADAHPDFRPEMEAYQSYLREYHGPVSPLGFDQWKKRADGALDEDANFERLQYEKYERNQLRMNQEVVLFDEWKIGSRPL